MRGFCQDGTGHAPRGQSCWQLSQAEGTRNNLIPSGLKLVPPLRAWSSFNWTPAPSHSPCSLSPPQTPRPSRLLPTTAIATLRAFRRPPAQGPIPSLLPYQISRRSPEKPRERKSGSVIFVTLFFFLFRFWIGMTVLETGCGSCPRI